jgi:hypothetical protein
VLGFFGRTGIAPTTGGQVLASAPNVIGAGSAAMNPILNYGSDLFNTNFNADAATRINNANNLAAIHGAIIGAVGNLGSGAMKMCWVARAIFGEERDGTGALKWERFRDQLLKHAPGWFHEAYRQHGERFAELLETRPELKLILRPWFERVASGDKEAWHFNS